MSKDFSGQDLSGVDMRNVTFIKQNIIDVIYHNTMMVGANLKHAIVKNSKTENL